MMNQKKKPTAIKPSEDHPVPLSTFNFTGSENFNHIFTSFEKYMRFSNDQQAASFRCFSPKVVDRSEPIFRDHRVSEFQTTPRRDTTPQTDSLHHKSPENCQKLRTVEPMTRSPTKHSSPREWMIDPDRELSFESDIEVLNKDHMSLLARISRCDPNRAGKLQLLFSCDTSTKDDSDCVPLQQLIFHLENRISNESGGDNMRYACKKCGAKFRDGCGLGGHVSKVHGGLKSKVKVRRVFKDFKHFDKERSKFFRKFESNKRERLKMGAS